MPQEGNIRRQRILLQGVVIKKSNNMNAPVLLRDWAHLPTVVDSGYT